jgi:hypothetical protein
MLPKVIVRQRRSDHKICRIFRKIIVRISQDVFRISHNHEFEVRYYSVMKLL